MTVTKVKRSWIMILLFGTWSNFFSGCAPQQKKAPEKPAKENPDAAVKKKHLPACTEYPPALQPAMRAAGKCE